MEISRGDGATYFILTNILQKFSFSKLDKLQVVFFIFEPTTGLLDIKQFEEGIECDVLQSSFLLSKSLMEPLMIHMIFWRVCPFLTSLIISHLNFFTDFPNLDSSLRISGVATLQLITRESSSGNIQQILPLDKALLFLQLGMEAKHQKLQHLQTNKQKCFLKLCLLLKILVILQSLQIYNATTCSIKYGLF